MDRKIRLTVIDDHELIVAALQRELNKEEDIEFTGTYHDAESALADLMRARPDVAIVDFLLPRMRGDELIAKMRARLPKLACLLFTGANDQQIQTISVAAGAQGLLRKPLEHGTLGTRIRAAAAGRVVVDESSLERLFRHLQDCGKPDGKGPLTEGELAVLDLRAEGKAYKEISTTLGRSEHTVHSHLRNSCRKLAVSGSKEAVTVARMLGLLEDNKQPVPSAASAPELLPPDEQGHVKNPDPSKPRP